jgi:hypothetical protein
MNTIRFTQLLEQTFKGAPEQLHGAEVWRLKRPRPLAPILEKVLDTDEERELYAGTFEAWPGNVHELLDGEGLRRPLLSVHWDGFGPISWSAGLDAIETGSRTCVCVWDEEESYRLLAAVAPARDSPALASVVAGLLSGGSLVHHVPHNVTNYVPGLLDRAAVEDAFAGLLDLDGGWGSLATEHHGRLVEPNHLQRCLDLLHQLPRLDDREAMEHWLKEYDDGPDLPEPARRKLLSEFLDLGYEEAA